ncbi:MAG: hypothetical protein LC731_08830, partial [Acidobacteria bacterium]|nr:hypothetical protein [Acidobacteriota bacterium]
MASTYSQTFLEGKSSQYGYALVILSGGLALIISQAVAPNATPLFFAVMAAVFASVWPDRPMQWAVWLCLPIFMLICIDLLVTVRVAALWRNGILFAKVFPFACLGSYI